MTFFEKLNAIKVNRILNFEIKQNFSVTEAQDYLEKDYLSSNSESSSEESEIESSRSVGSFF
jgi:hypothetical protein